MTVSHDGVSVEWVGYATVRVEWPGGTVAYTDPGRYGVLTGEWGPDWPGSNHPPATDRAPRDGDLVVVTHDDHYDPDGVERVARDDATVLVHEAVHADSMDRDVRPVDELPGDVVRVDAATDRLVDDVVVRTVEAYNRPDGRHVRADGSPVHPEGTGCGYLLTADDRTVFWPGDTDALDGYAELDVDVFLPPIGGGVTMDRHAAADLAEAMDPGLVVPAHYDTFEDLSADSAAFAADLERRGIPVALDEEGS